MNKNFPDTQFNVGFAAARVKVENGELTLMDMLGRILATRPFEGDDPVAVAKALFLGE
jgi:hypothetical protein